MSNITAEGLIRGMASVYSAIETLDAEAKSPKTEIHGSYTYQEKKLIEILTESTGADIMDSGGAYGRNWQHNREIKDWSSIPEKDVHVESYDHETWNLSISTNLFPYLNRTLQLNADTRRFNMLFKAFVKRSEVKDMGWPDTCEEFIRYLRNEKNMDVRYSSSFNTANADSTLSQVLQGVGFDYDERCFVLLQVHQGCDVRGGYTTPYIFEAEDDGTSVPRLIFDESDVYLACRCTNAHSDDCGYHWYGDYHPFHNNRTLDQYGFKSAEEWKTDYSLPKFWQPKEMKR